MDRYATAAQPPPTLLSPSFTRSTSCPTTTSGAHPCASQRSAAKSACSRTAPPPLLKLAAIPRIEIRLRRQTLRQQHRVAFQFHVEIRPPDPPPPAPRSPRRSDTSPGSARPRHTPRGRATDKRPAPDTPPRTPPRAPAPATPRAASDDAGSPPPAARSTPPPARRAHPDPTYPHPTYPHPTYPGHRAPAAPGRPHAAPPPPPAPARSRSACPPQSTAPPPPTRPAHSPSPAPPGSARRQPRRHVQRADQHGLAQIAEQAQHVIAAVERGGGDRGALQQDLRRRVEAADGRREAADASRPSAPRSWCCW